MSATRRKGGLAEAPGTEEPPRSPGFLMTSFWLIVLGVGVVGVLVAIALIVVSTQPESKDSVDAILSAGTGVIGTLVGSFLGLRMGTEGREQAQERVEAERRRSDDMLKTALAYLPPDVARGLVPTPPGGDIDRGADRPIS
jgi:hypothetical protein